MATFTISKRSVSGKETIYFKRITRTDHQTTSAHSLFPTGSEQFHVPVMNRVKRSEKSPITGPLFFSLPCSIRLFQKSLTVFSASAKAVSKLSFTITTSNLSANVISYSALATRCSIFSIESTPPDQPLPEDLHGRSFNKDR